MPPLKVLVVEDEAAIADTVVYALRTEGFEPRWCATGQEALQALQSEPVALCVLDVGLPDMNGFDVCRELRRNHSIPVIFLTSRGSEIDRIVGLELGADDYMAKPFSPRELTARIRAVLRRTHNGHSGNQMTTVAASPWRHDAARCRIEFHGKPVELTRNEYRLLCALIASPGRVFSRDQLMAAAWDDPGSATDRTVDAHVKSVRAKLRELFPDCDPIVTHRGLGYSVREEG